MLGYWWLVPPFSLLCCWAVNSCTHRGRRENGRCWCSGLPHRQHTNPISVCLSESTESCSSVVTWGAEHPPVSEGCWVKPSLWQEEGLHYAPDALESVRAALGSELPSMLNVCFWRGDTQRVDKGCLWCHVKIKTRNWVNLWNKFLLWSCFRNCPGLVCRIPSSLVVFSFLTSQKLVV